MKRINIIGLCLVAAFAMSLTVVASASATGAPKWGLCKEGRAGASLYEDSLCLKDTGTGNWEFEELTAQMAVTGGTPTGKGLVLEDMKAGTSIECEGTQEGFVGPGAEDEITKISATKCKFIKQGSCGASPPPVANAVNLPWKTQLLSETNKETGKLLLVIDILAHAGGGEPGWDVECTVGGFFKVQDTCKAPIAKLTVTAILHDVIDTEFTKLLTKEFPANCSLGGNKEGLVEGPAEIKPKTVTTGSLLTIKG